MICSFKVKENIKDQRLLFQFQKFFVYKSLEELIDFSIVVILFHEVINKISLIRFQNIEDKFFRHMHLS